MLRPRLIPSLLISSKALVKTVKFNKRIYIGDPLNAVRIFNEKNADELCIFDIDATTSNSEPNYDLIAKIANQCRMPLCYGGGISSVRQVERIINLGVEKVSVSTSAIDNPQLVEDISEKMGSQSIVVTLDVKKSPILNQYSVVTHNGKKSRKSDPLEVALKIEKMGVGEIIVNSIDRDGTKIGYDLELVSKFSNWLSVPLTILGGVGSLTDVKNLWSNYGIIGAGVGSHFVLKGKYDAVLINYPDQQQKEDLLFDKGISL